MRIDALRRLLDQRARVKVFVVLDDRCLCGYVSRHATPAPDLVVKLGTSVQVEFATMTITGSPFSADPLALSGMSKITRRIQTHRHHLVARNIPEQYFVRATAL